MHPDDRAAVDAEVARQIAERGEYVVEYRMKKQNGSYIWVHDLGRRITAENGMPAIISVCLDITAQKTAQAEVMHLYNNVPGAVFRVRYDDTFTVADASDGLYELLGYTRKNSPRWGTGWPPSSIPAIWTPFEKNCWRTGAAGIQSGTNTVWSARTGKLNGSH